MTILPDSKIEIVSTSSDTNTLKLNIDFATLTEADKKYLLEFLSLNETQFLHLDLSSCNLENCDSYSITFPLLISVKKFESYQLLPIIEAINIRTLNFNQIYLLQTEAELNKKSREELVPHLIDIFLQKDNFSEKIKSFHLFNSTALKGHFLKSCFEIFCSDPLAAFVHIKALLNYTKAKNIFLGEKGIIDSCENRYQVTTHLNFHKIEWLIRYILAFERAYSTIDKSFTEQEEELYRRLFGQLFSITDNELHLKLFNLSFSALKDHPTSLFSFLAVAKRRRHPIAVGLSEIYLDVNQAKTDGVLTLFSNNLYEEAIYFRTASQALCMLAQDINISKENKKLLTKICCHQLIGKDKSAHYSVWSMLITLLSGNSTMALNSMLNKREILSATSLEKFYWEILREQLNIPDSSYPLYLKHFEPNQNTKHHLLFGFHQSFSNEDSSSSQLMVADLIKTLLFEGKAGYYRLRYKSPSSHLETVFNGSYSEILKHQWMYNPKAIEFPTGILKGCRVYITDDLWELLTWGEGFNCLDPLYGYDKHLAHLLNGEHQLALIRDNNNKVIAGYIVHLLLKDPKNSKPVLAVGKTYLQRDTPLEEKEIQEIRAILDNAVAQKSLRMGIPFAALKLNGESEPPRHLPFQENSATMLIKCGFTGLAADGIDYDFVAAERYENHSEFKSYQIVYSPPSLALENAAVDLKQLYLAWALEEQKKDLCWMRDYNKNMLLSRNSHIASVAPKTLPLSGNEKEKTCLDSAIKPKPC